MPSPQIERKLAAIMFTDIAGYTALSAKDETKALKLLDTQKQILTPIIEEFNGTLHKEMGDGLLFTFPTVTEAVNCGIKIQEQTKANDDLNLRVGIHEGEITLKDGDVLGDDINVASRIEPFSALGGIAISGKVQQNISSLSEFETKYIGKPKLKGVSQEVKVYCITSHGLPKTDISKVSAKLEEETRFNIFTLTGGILTAIGIAFWIAVGVFDVSFGGKVEIPSIGIMLMENRGDEGDEFWARSITEDLIVKVAGAGVIRVAPMKEILEIDIKDSFESIAKQLRVKYLLISSIYKKEELFDLRCQLIEAESGNSKYANKWSETIDFTPTIVGNLAENILRTLKVSTNKDLTKPPTKNSKAYEYYLKGKYKFLNRINIEDVEVARDIFREAIDLDENLLLAHDLLAWSFLIYQDFGDAMEVYQKNLNQAIKNEDKYIEGLSLTGIGNVHNKQGNYEKALDYQLEALVVRMESGDRRMIGHSLLNLGNIYQSKGDIEKAVSYYIRGLEINEEIQDEDGIVVSHISLAHLYLSSKPDFNKALEHLLTALPIAERYTNKNSQRLFITTINDIGFTYMNKAEYGKAINYYNRGLKIIKKLGDESLMGSTFFNIGNVYYNKGDYNGAIDYFGRSLKIKEKLGQKRWVRIILQKTGWVQFKMGYYDKALEYYNRELAIDEELGDKKSISNDFANMGLVFFQQGFFLKAFEYFDKSATMQMEKDSTITLETASHLVLIKKMLGKEYKVAKINSLIKEQQKEVDDYINYTLYKIFEDKSYLETAYNQIQEKAENLEPDVAAKFLNYPIPKAIVEEWEKAK